MKNNLGGIIDNFLRCYVNPLQIRGSLSASPGHSLTNTYTLRCRPPRSFANKHIYIPQRTRRPTSWHIYTPQRRRRPISCAHYLAWWSFVRPVHMYSHWSPALLVNFTCASSSCIYVFAVSTVNIYSHWSPALLVNFTRASRSWSYIFAVRTVNILTLDWYLCFILPTGLIYRTL